MDASYLRLRGIRENNLQNFDLQIAHGQLIVVTGVSGSGKSSLAFEVVAHEGQRRFLETFSSFSRQSLGNWKRPDMDEATGLSPVITLSQQRSTGNARSTVGTLSEGYDLLRLLFARLGQHPDGRTFTRSHFSFNSPKGACPRCQGLGLEERISERLLVADPSLTLREGAMAPTLPTGYIMYSQVTVDALNLVCKAHGFSVDIPWQDLEREQQEVVFFGSERVKVPYGKHSIESRLKWTGINANPREEGFYKGLIPIMSDILKRDRNPSILRYTESVTCPECKGHRLHPEALNVTVNGVNIAHLAALELEDLKHWWEQQQWSPTQSAIANTIGEALLPLLNWFDHLGVNYLSFHRGSSTLSGGERQRIRLINQLRSGLSDVLYVFDEPSIGLHPKDNAVLLQAMRTLVAKGNTVLVVEHDLATIRHADWIVDLGPVAGEHGGQLLFSGRKTDYLGAKELQGISPTYNALHAPQKLRTPGAPQAEQFLYLSKVATHNLHNLEVRFLAGSFNVVTGVAGSGKSSLVFDTLLPRMERLLSDRPFENGHGWEAFQKVVAIDQTPIGRTPRSNPATYTGLADRIRDVFAQTPAAKKAGFKKSRFSFNTKGGRCETCQGAGVITIGMHFLGNVATVCSTCEGKRFNLETLSVDYRGKNIAEIFELSVAEGLDFFADQPKITVVLQALNEVGLGYLRLGQASTTLSGGEAQRVKLASELYQRKGQTTLYLLDEPTVGLHQQDVAVLLKSLRALLQKGNTVICIEHDESVIRQADWLVDLGPGGGRRGGQLMAEGAPTEVAKKEQSITGRALSQALPVEYLPIPQPAPNKEIVLKGVNTHLLQSVSVRFPKNRLSVVAGVSGSGKSSLVFGTLYAEAQQRFTENWSAYHRSRLPHTRQADLEHSEGLGPVVAIGRKFNSNSPRSTVGTISGIYDHLRLFYSRLAQLQGLPYSAQHFSFNHQLGACLDCEGLGSTLCGNPEAIIRHPKLSVVAGAVAGNRVANYYGNPEGQFVAILKAAAQAKGMDISLPWEALDSAAQQLILYGTGDQIWETTWAFKTTTRSGEQAVKAPWLGFCGYVEDEFRRKQHNKNTEALRALLRPAPCTTCHGERLRPERLAVTLAGKSIADWCTMPIQQLASDFYQPQDFADSPSVQALIQEISPAIQQQMNTLHDLGLPYLNLNRAAPSLSAGEAQRLRLAGQLAAKLFGVTYVFDEPTVGLHPTNTQRLMRLLKSLTQNGNTVVVVEHDLEVIRQADYVIEMGPGSGLQGGSVLYEGPPSGLLQHTSSVTAPYLKESIQWKLTPHSIEKDTLKIVGARANNLKDIDLELSSGGLIAVSGVSGSGKTSLVRDVLLASLMAGEPRSCRQFEGLHRFQSVQWVDHRPLSGNASSTPATYIGLMEVLRQQFAALPTAKARGLKKSAFSYLHKDGRCPECHGSGRLRTELDFLSEVQQKCESCQGLRYRPAVLDILWEGRSMGKWLQQTVDEAYPVLSQVAKARPFLDVLQKMGLGHLPLGQPGNSLSGGEAQRLKLAKIWTQKHPVPSLLLLDEPSTGLHLKDVEKLAKAFHQLALEGHTVLYIEHHPELIQLADQRIELGPEGGSQGGQLLCNEFKKAPCP